MPTLFLMCGLPGSGKTTKARELEERESALRLDADEWMVPLFGQHMPREVFDVRLAQVRALQWQVAERALRLGVNVVLDWGFWRAAERRVYAAHARDLGAKVELWFFDVDRQVLLKRLHARNETLPPGTFQIDESALVLFESIFEPPLAFEELEIVRFGR